MSLAFSAGWLELSQWGSERHVTHLIFMSQPFALVELENWFPCWLRFALRSHFGLSSVPSMSESDPVQPFSLWTGEASHTDRLRVEITHYFLPEGVSVGIAAFPDGFLHMLKFDWVDIRPTVTRAPVCVWERVCVWVCACVCVFPPDRFKCVQSRRHWKGENLGCFCAIRGICSLPGWLLHFFWELFVQVSAHLFLWQDLGEFAWMQSSGSLTLGMHLIGCVGLLSLKRSSH